MCVLVITPVAASLLSGCGSANDAQTAPNDVPTLATARIELAPGVVPLSDAIAAFEAAMNATCRVSDAIDLTQVVDIPGELTAVELLALLVNKHQLWVDFDDRHRSAAGLEVTLTTPEDEWNHLVGAPRAAVLGPALFQAHTVYPDLDSSVRLKPLPGVVTEIDIDPFDGALAAAPTVRARLPNGRIIDPEPLPREPPTEVDVLVDLEIRDYARLEKIVFPLVREEKVRWRNYTIRMGRSENIDSSDDPYDHNGPVVLRFKTIDLDDPSPQLIEYHAANASLDLLKTSRQFSVFSERQTGTPGLIEFFCEDPSFDHVVIFLAEDGDAHTRGGEILGLEIHPKAKAPEPR
ncbi:MAG: hypothetical protein AAGI30_02225 [Planctomycetota bacterium]